MPYRQGARLPGERASKIAHIDVLKDNLVNEMMKEFDPNDAASQSKQPGWEPLPTGGAPLPYIFSVDGSFDIATSDEPPYWKLTFVKTALLILDQQALSALDKESPNPFQLRDILAKSAVYHSAVFPLKNISYSGLTIYHAIRKALFKFVKDASPPMRGEPMSTLKWLAYRKWEGQQQGLKPFGCPHCDENVATLPYDAEVGKCPNPKCGKEIFITDMLGFHQEMMEDAAPDRIATNYMNVHELLLLFTGIRYFWENNKKALAESLFVKDGPLMIRAQYSKLVQPIRDFIEHAKKEGYNINIIGQEKDGAFVEYMDMIGRDAPLGTMFIPGDTYIKEEIQQRPSNSSQMKYGKDTNYGAKVFVKLDNYHKMVLTVPTGEFKSDAKAADLVGLDRIVATLPTILSNRYEGALLPIELVHGIASLSTYPSAEILKIFAKALMRN